MAGRFPHLAGSVLNRSLGGVDQAVARLAHPFVFLPRLRNGKADRSSNRERDRADGQRVLVHRAIEAVLGLLSLVLGAGLDAIGRLVRLIDDAAHAILRARRELAAGLANL